MGLTALVVDDHPIMRIGVRQLILAQWPEAQILELGEWGIRRCEWDDTDLVTNHRAFLRTPQAFLRHVVGD